METMFQFQKAVPVWIGTESGTCNHLVGFFGSFSTEKEKKITLFVAARSYYRVYVNQELLANGPARTAAGYCRVDRLAFMAKGRVSIAVEVLEADKPEKYSNDCTLEKGMFCLEAVDEAGKVLLASGEWERLSARELRYRICDVELMSHSRGIIEFYRLTADFCRWRIDGFAGKGEQICPYAEQVTFLERRAPYPTYEKAAVRSFEYIGDWETGGGNGRNDTMVLSRTVNPEWYAALPPENEYLPQMTGSREYPFSGSYSREPLSDTVSVKPGARPFYLLYSDTVSRLGFVEISLTCKERTVLDVVTSDHKSACGLVEANTYLAHYELEKGSYRLLTQEPKLVRYIKLMIRSKGEVVIRKPELIDYSYPDTCTVGFSCSDNDLNRIYEGARRTLKFNTLDIFMDCPERERGGWLCDSYFTAQAAWQMFGDRAVEKDFLWNFMLTDGTVKKNGFFPEVYPGSKKDPSDVGIMNWSFWLMAQLADYAARSGDQAFLAEVYPRVEMFADGLLMLRGKSGLLEGMDVQFVDWSLSNADWALNPVNIPNNCLAVRILEELGALYDRRDWTGAAQEMRAVIEKMDAADIGSGRQGDAAVYENGILHRTGYATEGGIALEFWSGFHREDPVYVRKFVEEMGTAPVMRSDPNIAKANLFIGLMIRFDVLYRMGKIDTLLEEMRDVYLPELREGSGTFFENYNAHSGCHGFNGMAGVFLTGGVLGLGIPDEKNRTVVVSPHPGALKWAAGSVRTCDGDILMKWAADDWERMLSIDLLLPAGWSPTVRIGDGLSDWKVLVNGVPQ